MSSESQPLVESTPYLTAYAGDPLGVFLIDRLHLSPWLGAALTLLAALIFDGIASISLQEDLLELHGWTDTWAYLIYSYGVGPLVVAAYLWISTASGRLFLNLRNSEALRADRATYDTFVREENRSLQATHSYRRWFLASVFLVLLLALYMIIRPGDTAQWSSSALLLRGGKVVLLFVPVWYMICQIIVRETVTIWGLWHAFRVFEVTPHPLHPDRCGGLRAINDYVVGFTYIIALTGVGVIVLVSASWNFHGSTLTWMNGVILSVYIILALACFFLPPWTAHSAMARAKTQMLGEISKRFQVEYSALRRGLDNGATNLGELVERLDNLRSLHQLTEDFPVWPFDTRTLSRFAVTIAAPVIPLILEMGIETIG